ncbi:uncharacterized protein LOC116197637 [Punica granatum]|uniref:Uncharacterized protein LOC116197637 n=2 Tax=Punica granatum TaxID=22663 RepID=A0A6P8CMU1_PUNGR|nr:uncharacterized protein LOC116197637 [Punica granatum]XP_031383685.1 uncharacterized protein LOC116197637 [Punica granatum]XP_031383686.1 uncharacterized protein LOC116197637 [Punica granatum]XP_031383687.1 uncharacterized protein LOC116197637 [Punica granatum]XP_031383688.1 uncharacterized protein LOC116197637 [Punica granatum]XP_031383689.1 uncharacterized protein LOC116197637 [Punica granatum]OWM70062.1 hypothetical protein CDL15_Pgr025911 [Punica granatum]PKI72386.1 hypothetical prote
MKSLSGVGLGLSVVFGCLLLALVGELYYLLWWKKRATNRSIEGGYCIRSNGSPAKELLHIFCLKKPSSVVSQSALDPQEAYPPSPAVNDSGDQQLVQSNENGDGKDLLVKPLEQDTMEAELARLHKLAGPPRFLFTIVEETREDLFDSEDGRSRKGSRGRSLSDLLVALETPYLTPIASPSLFTPPLTPIESGYSQHGFNPRFESSSDAEFNRIRASPPPKFKFMQDAEEKLRRKMTVGDTQRSGSSHGQEFSIRDHSLEPVKDEEDGSFITIVVDESRERREHNQKHHHNRRPEAS